MNNTTFYLTLKAERLRAIYARKHPKKPKLRKIGRHVPPSKETMEKVKATQIERKHPWRQSYPV